MGRGEGLKPRVTGGLLRKLRDSKDRWSIHNVELVRLVHEQGMIKCRGACMLPESVLQIDGTICCICT